MSHPERLLNLCTMSAKTHIFMTVRPSISFAIYNCKLEIATVFFCRADTDLKRRKLSPYLLWVENETFLNSFPSIFLGTIGFR